LPIISNVKQNARKPILFREFEIVFVGGYSWGSGSASVFKLNVGTGTCYQSWALPLQVAVIRYSLLSE
jgi:hypothetical protein